MAGRPRRFSNKTVHWIRTSGMTVAHMARELGVTESPVRECIYGRTYQDHPTPPKPMPEKPAYMRHNRRPPNATILQWHERDGLRPYEIAHYLGVSRGCIVSAIRRAKDARAKQNTSPSDARQPSRGSGATAPSLSTTTAHSGGDVTSSNAASCSSAASEGGGLDNHRREASLSNSPAGTPKPAGASSGKNASAGKAAGGRKSAQRANAYFRIHGGKQRHHDRAREAVRKTDTNACMACQSAPVAQDGLCTDCASVVQRARPAAAYGAEPNHLSRGSSGTEADNVILSEVEI
jgi:predicted XRE-type DNA-binding protein